MANATENTTPAAENQEAAEAQTQTSVEIIDDVCVIVSADAAGTLLAPVIVEKPAAGETYSLLVEPGKKYFFNFEQDDVSSFTQKDGELTVTFKDGSTIVLENYAEATTSDASATFAFTDEFSTDAIKVVDTTPEQNLLEEVKAEIREETTVEEVAQVEPAAGEEAQELAQIEPAAGDEGGGDAGGYGFQSSFDAQGVIPLDDVGPIDPTALQYGVQFNNDILFFEDAPQNDVPDIDDNPGIGSGVENVDETNILPESVSGSVVHTYGNDGPGSFGGSGTFSSGYMLTSHGNPVAVSFDSGTGTYTGVANGNVVFTLVVESNGDYTFEQFLPIDHADATNPDDAVQLLFGIEIFDVDGDTDTGNITINIFDDGPTLDGDGTKLADEDLLGPVVINGDLVENFGEDGPGTIEPNGFNNATGDLAGGILSSGGEAITINQTGTGYEGVNANGTVFTVTIDPLTGAYTFTLNEPLDHSVGGDTITLTFGADIVDYDGDRDYADIVIDVKDSGPEIRNDNPTIGNGLENVDETNVLPETVNGSLTVDYGADTPGTLGPNGSFTTSHTLTSHGQTVTVDPTTSGYVATLPDGVTKVFEITVDANGDYSFTQFLPLDHADTTDPNDVINLSFGVTVTDFDGDTDSGQILINIFDDGPDLVGDGTKMVHENNLSPTTSVNGNLVEDFGEDGQGEIHPNDFKQATGDLAGGVLSSNGVPVIISATPDGYVGMAGGTTVFTVTINSVTGAYTFTLNEPLDHSVGGDTITLTFGAEIVDYDGDTDSANIVIDVKDSGPEIRNDNPTIGNGREVVDDTDLGPNVASGHVNIDFGNDGPGTFGGDGTHTTSAALFSGGEAVNVTFNSATNTYTGTTTGGTPVFTLEIESNGDYTFTQLAVLDHPDETDHNDAITINFGIEIFDADGDTDTSSIRIDILDDGPVAHDDHNQVDHGTGTATGNVVTGLNGGPGAADDLSQDADNTVTKIAFGATEVVVPTSGTATINGTYGQLEIDADGNYTYTSFGGVSTPASMHNLNPSSSDVAGTQSSITKDGITVSSWNGADLRWVNEGAGPGIGIAGGGSDKVWTSGETLEVRFDHQAETVKVKISDIGANNTTGGIDFVVLVDGIGPVNYEFNIGTTTPVGGVIEITLNAADFGGRITGFDVNSIANSGLSTTSFLLKDVKTTVPGEIDCGTDEFLYTLTDGDGDTSTATLSLECEPPPTTVDVRINNGADDVCVKEDGQVAVPLTANYTGGDGDEAMTLTLSGVAPGWVVTAPGWTNNGGGVFTLTLPVGQHNYSGDITFKPPANSDVDLTGITLVASLADPDVIGNISDSDSFDIHVDAVVDTPVLNASLNASYSWHKDYAHEGALNISSNVTDTDGSEQVTKIVIKLNTPFSNGAGGYNTLDDMGVSLNKGTEVSPGVWEIAVNSGDTSAALAGLKMLVPAGGNAWWPIHQSKVGGHKATITIESHVSEANLSGEECDYTDNDTVVIKCVDFCFYITPLALDLDGDGIEVLNIDAGVMFDMNSNGTLDKTSWIAGDDGFLAIDLNGDGVINDQSELFGNDETAEDGFAKLALYDTNGDGLVDINDDVFSDLIVWQDLNSDGVSQAGEMSTLSEQGIVSINLAAEITGTEIGDVFVSHESTYTNADGSTGKIVDAWFNVQEGSTIGQGVEINGTSLNDIIYGTDGNDLIFGGAGKDIFVFESGGGLDTVADFEIGDSIDISALLEGYDPVTDAIADFVFKTEADGNTTIYVNESGVDGLAGATAIAVLDGVTGLNIEQITNNGGSAIV